MIICHPFLVKKEVLVTRDSYRKKRIFALSETNKTRFPAEESRKAVVSRLKKGREKTSHSFLSQPHLRIS